MADNGHRNYSNKSGLDKETKEDSISATSLGCRLYALGSDTYIGFAKMTFEIEFAKYG